MTKLPAPQGALTLKEIAFFLLGRGKRGARRSHHTHLYSNFAEYAKKHNLPPFPINGDKRAKPAKIQRLLAITGHYERGNVYFNTAEQENRHMQNLLEQHLSFNPPHKTPLDGIDAIEGAMYLIDRHIEDFAGALRLAKRTRNPANSY